MGIRVGVKSGFADTPLGELEAWFEEGVADFAEFSLCDDPMPDPRAYVGPLPTRTVHAPHYASHGFNAVDPGHRDVSLRMLEASSAAADVLGARYVIFHPENSHSSRDSSLGHLASVLAEHGDPRVIVENMPCPGFFMVEPEEIRGFMAATGTGLCLDVSHAAGYAFLTGRDYATYLAELASLGPVHWHASDTIRVLSPGSRDGYRDEHLPLGHGDIEWDLVRSLLPDDAWVTLETPRGDTQRRDSEIIRGR